MTPVPKGLTKKQVLAWRRAMRRTGSGGRNPIRTAALVKKGPIRFRD